MKSTSSADISESEELIDQSRKQASDKILVKSKDMEQEKSLRITIRVPSRCMTGKRSRRRRIEAIESISESELDELSSSNDFEETVLEESLDTDDSEEYIERSRELKEKVGELTRLTKRQRARIDEDAVETNDLVQLPETIKRRHQNLTEEELALKRNELARRRKNLSEQKLEEEKMGTINKLLSKQVMHKYKRIKVDDEGASEEEKNVPKVSSPIMSRWIDRKEGTVFAIPKKWLDINVSTYFEAQKGSVPSFSQRLCSLCGGVGIYNVIGSVVPMRACSISCLRLIQSKT
ncbi:hypothetical protein PNEG_03051 [Pneumocystis murina B123]|uniref:INO80 complex subunit B-like conserved region domain-containing protein n=1 Tax=Pneumocystis murina (strain B123) TaxID=1069680 RepID=M7PDN0_PNEMU|nr:hypothetical protein PNEG_03051 [Pneumocystis murina B123]EMR08574.1 hypothetical protein PNEG_03051 [Pneumocystis murina B123]